MVSREKEVRYDIFCSTCEHFEKFEDDDPCDECLATPTNVDSIRPVNHKKIEKE